MYSFKEERVGKVARVNSNSSLLSNEALSKISPCAVDVKAKIVNIAVKDVRIVLIYNKIKRIYN